VARILLGAGESFLVVGIFKWGFALVGPAHTGRVMVWNGMGMYAGMACGAPSAILLQTHAGLPTVFAVTITLPGIIYLIMRLLPAVALPIHVTRLPFMTAVRLVWASGSALALASIGFGDIASFISLFFIQNHWPNASLALTAFGGSYIIVRLLFSGAPDKFGGAKVALISLGIEVAGQLLIWAGVNGMLTIVGTAITGMGMSLVFPALGQLAVKKVEPANRGMAIAAYNAFFDLGMGITAPLAGLIAGRSHYQQAYLLGALAAATSIILVYWELRKVSNEKYLVNPCITS
jgi:MFS family permease